MCANDKQTAWRDTAVVRDGIQLIGFSPAARRVRRGLLYNRILCVNDHFLASISELQWNMQISYALKWKLELILVKIKMRKFKIELDCYFYKPFIIINVIRLILQLFSSHVGKGSWLYKNKYDPVLKLLRADLTCDITCSIFVRINTARGISSSRFLTSIFNISCSPNISQAESLSWPRAIFRSKHYIISSPLISCVL